MSTLEIIYIVIWFVCLLGCLTCTVFMIKRLNKLEKHINDKTILITKDEYKKLIDIINN